MLRRLSQDEESTERPNCRYSNPLSRPLRGGSLQKLLFVRPYVILYTSPEPGQRPFAVHFYYAANSNERLRAACRRLEQAFSLPPFVFESHDQWEYGCSERPGLWMNITRTPDCRTIETWMPNCPTNTNFQVILRAEVEPPDFVHRLAEILGDTVVRYAPLPLGSNSAAGEGPN